jgi:hypothetical protein
VAPVIEFTWFVYAGVLLVVVQIVARVFGKVLRWM